MIVSFPPGWPPSLSTCAAAPAIGRLAASAQDRAAGFTATVVASAYSAYAPGWRTTITASLPLGIQAPGDSHPLDRLNPRELEVLAGIAEGLRNRVIAERLRLSEHTVKFHVRTILDKLKVSSRGEAAALAAPGRPGQLKRIAAFGQS
jgi:DNA-binding NarL/FixJ family response regulator